DGVRGGEPSEGLIDGEELLGRFGGGGRVTTIPPSRRAKTRLAASSPAPLSFGIDPFGTETGCAAGPLARRVPSLGAFGRAAPWRASGPLVGTAPRGPAASAGRRVGPPALLRTGCASLRSSDRPRAAWTIPNTGSESDSVGRTVWVLCPPD